MSITFYHKSAVQGHQEGHNFQENLLTEQLHKYFLSFQHYNEIIVCGKFNVSYKKMTGFLDIFFVKFKQ